MDQVDLHGKVIIVTGSNAGIGRETVRILAEKGARIIMACRSEERTEPERKLLIQETGNDQIVFMKLDLASLESVRNFAREFNENEDRLDILINNAGLNKSKRELTVDGYELMFGTNHLGHFLLTNLLMDKLKSSSPSRIVTVSSLGHEKNPIDLEDLNADKKFDSLQQYGRSKSANILFSVQLAKILEGSGVTSYSLHPGAINTQLGRELPCYGCCCYPCILCCLVRLMFCQTMKSETEGAMTTIYCSIEPSIADHSGRYYSDIKEKPAKPHATDPETAQKLWDISKEMCGL